MRGADRGSSPTSVSVILLPVVEACVVMAVRGRVVRVAADEPEAADLDPGVLARGLDTPATVKAARLCRRERDRYAHLVRGARGF